MADSYLITSAEGVYKTATLRRNGVMHTASDAHKTAIRKLNGVNIPYDPVRLSVSYSTTFVTQQAAGGGGSANTDPQYWTDS